MPKAKKEKVVKEELSQLSHAELKRITKRYNDYVKIPRYSKLTQQELLAQLNKYISLKDGYIHINSFEKYKMDYAPAPRKPKETKEKEKEPEPAPKKKEKEPEPEPEPEKDVINVEDFEPIFKLFYSYNKFSKPEIKEQRGDLLDEATTKYYQTLNFKKLINNIKQEIKELDKLNKFYKQSNLNDVKSEYVDKTYYLIYGRLTGLLELYKKLEKVGVPVNIDDAKVVVRLYFEISDLLKDNPEKDVKHFESLKTKWKL